ncbi:MAG: flagellar FliJ family protein [Maricaulaceae bacterium]
MRNYQAMIKLARFKVDELQKQMSAIDAARESLKTKVGDLESQVPNEQVAADSWRDGFIAYGSYAQAVNERKDNLRASISEVDAQAAGLRASMQQAFQELKKFELLEERRVARERAKREKKLQAELDDMAMQRAMAGPAF